MTRVSKNSEPSQTIKFLYSYGGKILPRQIDGELRYVGGHTRILTVDCCISYSELIVKFWDSCGSSMNLRCKLPSEDLDLLVHVTCDENLANVIEEYDRTNQDMKIRAILDPVRSLKKISPSPSVADLSSSKPSNRYPVVDFSAPKRRGYPVPGFSASRSYNPAIYRHIQFVPQWNYY